MHNLEFDLRNGLIELALPAGETQVAGLLDYLALLQKWNKVYNLTAVRDQDQMLTHHLLDSLAVIAPLRRQFPALRIASNGPAEVTASVEPEQELRLLDVGSGAGLPGVVVAILCPQIQVDCVDAVAKKAGFINQVALSLKLDNLRGLHARVEGLSGKYRVICSRAFASLPDFVGLSAAALAWDGVWLAMKGEYPVDEIAALPVTVKVFHVEQLKVPGLAAKRCLVWLRKT